MYNEVFCLYNSLSLRYGDCFVFPTAGFAKARIIELAKAKRIDLAENELCRVGRIDISTGLITPCAAPERIPLDIPTVDEMAKEVVNSN